MTIEGRSTKKVWLPVGAAVFLVAAATALFASVFEPRESILGFGALFLASSAILGAVLWRYRQELWALHGRRALVLLVVVAALFRLAAFVAPISLSDDIWRYLWDGELVAAAENPYVETATERMERGDGDRELYDALNRPDNHTVYPPLAQGVFAAAVSIQAAVGGSAERWLRALFIFFELLGVFALGAVLIRLGRSPMWAALYAWHPLAYWEVAAGGHTEALGIVWLVALVGFAVTSRPVVTGIAIGLAGLAKWTFLVVSPVVAFFLLRRRGWSAAISATASALLVFIGGYIPFYFDRLLANQLESFRLYAEHFSFNAPIYYSFRWVLGYREGITEPVTHITGPVLTVVTILAVALIAWWQDGSRRRLVAGVALATAAYVVFTPVFHPWYALPLLAMGALAGWTTPAVLGAVIVVSYAFYAPWTTPGVEAALMAGQAMVVLAWAMWEFGPNLLQRILARRGARKASVISDFLDGHETICDLGAGEGYVGAALADRGHEVQLADVVDRNRSELPLIGYDGERLPVDDNQFDVVVISYVLHHAADPDAVLAEALRVGRQVIVLETVYERQWDRRLVTFLDHSANALRGMSPEPLRLDTVDGWLQRLDSLGAEVTTWRWLGRSIHRHVVIAAKRKTPRSK